MPEKSAISRFRLTLDVSLMLAQRVRHWNAFQAQQRCVRFLTWDSSPQFHKDYELALVESFQVAGLRDVIIYARRMSTTVQNDMAELIESNPDVCNPHFDDMAKVASLCQRHRLPSVCIGFGASSFPSKLGALCHAMRLEQFTASMLEIYIKEFKVVLSDDGTERLLNNLMPTPLQNIIPFFEDTPAEDIKTICRRVSNLGMEQVAGDDLVGEDPGFDLAGVQDDFADVAEPMADFTGSLGFSGVHHIIDNATKGLKDILDDWDDNIAKTKAVCKLLRDEGMRDKLLERCFSGPVARHMHPELKSFKGWVHEGRWGTIAFSMPELIRVHRTLTWGWDTLTFLRGDDADEEGNLTVFADTCDEAITSRNWWGWIFMMEQISSILRSGISWVDRCSCHEEFYLHFRHGQMPREIAKMCDMCPMKCRRGPELANGELLNYMDDAARICAGSLVIELAGLLLEPAARLGVLRQFDLAKASVMFYLTAKLCYATEEPWNILLVGHLDIDGVAKPALQRALGSLHRHALLFQPWLRHVMPARLAGPRV